MLRAQARQDDLGLLPVQVQKGVTAVTLRPLNAKRHAVAGDPRPLLAQLRVEGFEYQPQPAATGTITGFKGGSYSLAGHALKKLLG